MRVCYHCKKEWKGDYKPGRRDICDHCGMDLHCCLNCQFHDNTSYNECREPQAERVLEKESSNFCDYFQFKDTSITDQIKKSDNKKSFDDLFK